MTRASIKFAVFLVVALAFGFVEAPLWAAPTAVEHTPGVQAFSQAPDVTQREPETPREADAVEVNLRVSFQFTYDRVAIYWTNDGSEPGGSFGVGTVGTQVLSNSGGQVTFVTNESTMEGTRDWWKATLPVSAREYGQTIKYRISAWDTGGGGEVFANGGSSYSYVNKLAWPGAGAGSPNPGQGYPPVYFWKEEAMVGNNYINLMLDQNGTIFDIFYPGAGAWLGVATKNEGYAGGNDTFPPFTSGRGQMHVNQVMCGIRVDGLTYWMSNESGLGYDNVAQAYNPDSNTVISSSRLHGGGNNIAVQQYDFCPKGINFPNDLDGNPNRGLYVKRMILTNNGPSTKVINLYAYGDFAINGGDGSDAMYQDGGASHGAMVAFDNAGGSAISRGEYNPRFAPDDYPKNVSVFLGTALKKCAGVGDSAGTPATDSWRDTSADNGQGWIGMQLTLDPGVPVEVDMCIAGGFKQGLFADVGDRQIRPALDWFFANSMSSVMGDTDAYWQSWLNEGVLLDTPDTTYDELFKRGLLATALHLDGVSGAVAAGYHNGAYPFCWPRDAVYAAVCLARVGHLPEADKVYQWMRDVAYRDNESWGKGFWKQKYTMDGHVVWPSPQIDETAVFPWGVYYQYLITGDLAFLGSHYDEVRDAAFTCSTSPGDAGLHALLNYNATERLMWSNNVWEDQYGFFIYSNANVVRGLQDAAAIAGALGNNADSLDFGNRADTIRGGLTDKLNANAEVTDISQLGIVYPFDIFDSISPQAVNYIDRVNGVANDTTGNSHPLVNFNDDYGWLNLINRYWGDSYWGNGSPASPWGAGPWFLSTLWYGLYYAERADHTGDKVDIDNHKFRIDLCIDELGPIGFGAEQIAPSCNPCTCPNCGSLLYPGQTDFVLQTAWPNAWESMSTFVDALMAFLDYKPQAPTDSFIIEPNLPTGWNTMTFSGLRLKDKRFNVRCDEEQGLNTHTLTNVTGGTLHYTTQLRVPTTANVFAVTADCQYVAAVLHPASGRLQISGTMNAGAGSDTVLRAYYGLRGDFDLNAAVDMADLPVFVNVLLGLDPDCANNPIADMDGDFLNDGGDIQPFIDALLP